MGPYRNLSQWIRPRREVRQWESSLLLTRFCCCQPRCPHPKIALFSVLPEIRGIRGCQFAMNAIFEVTFCGRRFTVQEVELMRQMTHDYADLGVTEIAR